MAWSILQSNGIQPDPGAAAATYLNNVQAGTKLICFICTGGGGNPQVTAVKDGALNAMTKLASAFLNNTAASGELSVWAMDTPAGDVGTKPTITATQTGGNQSLGMVIAEVSGLLPGNTTAMLDGTPANNTGNISSNGSVSWAAFSTAAAGELLYAVGADNEVGTLTWAAPTGSTTYTRDSHAVNGSFVFNCVPSSGNSTGGAETASASITGVSGTNAWATIFLAFQLAGAGPVQKNANPGLARKLNRKFTHKRGCKSAIIRVQPATEYFPVGTLDSNSASGLTTLAHTNLGMNDVLVLGVKLTSTSITVSSVTGGGATGWTKVAGPNNDGTRTQEIWIGTVNTTGAQTITVNFSSSNAGLSTDLDVQEFGSILGASAVWAADGASGFLNNGSSTTVTYPTLAPSTGMDLYVAQARVPSAGTFSNLTAGFAGQVDANGNPYIYGTSVTSSVSPTQTDSVSAASATLAVLLSDRGSTGTNINATGVEATGVSSQPVVEIDLPQTGVVATGSAPQAIVNPQVLGGTPTATGTAPAAVPNVIVLAGIPTATGAAPAPAVQTGLIINAPVPTATGTAPQPVVAEQVLPGVPTATGSSPAAVPNIQVVPGIPTATGSAPTTTRGVGVPPATATGTAPQAVVSESVLPGIPTATGSAAAVVNPSPTPGIPTATGTAAQPVVSEQVLAGIPVATGVAPAPQILTGLIVNAPAVTATGAAPSAVPNIQPLGGTVTATGTAPQAASSPSVLPGAPTATGGAAAVANVKPVAGIPAATGGAAAVASIFVNATIAVATGAAPAPGILTGLVINAPAVTASGVVAQPTVAETVFAGIPFATGTAPATSRGVGAGAATATGAAPQPGKAMAVNALIAIVAGAVGPAQAVSVLPHVTARSTSSVDAKVVSTSGAADPREASSAVAGRGSVSSVDSSHASTNSPSVTRTRDSVSSVN